MAAHVQDIVYNVTGQTVFFDPPEPYAPSSPSVSVFPMTTGDDGTADTALGTPTVSGVSTTVDAASGAAQTDARVLYVAATTSMNADEPLLATATAGQSEIVVPWGVVSADHIVCRLPLQHNYVSADTVVGMRISATIDATWVADISNLSDVSGVYGYYRCRWAYTSNGSTVVHDSYFNLVRYPAAHQVSPNDVDALFPGWITTLPVDYRETQGRALIDKAWEEVKLDLRETGLYAHLIRDQAVLDNLTAYKTALVALQTAVFHGALDAAERLDVLTAAYQRRLDGFARVTTKVHAAVDNSGAGHKVSATGVWSR